MAAPNEAGAAQDKIDNFAAAAEDLNAIRAVLVDAAAVSAGLWLSYLFMFFYLLVAAAGVSQQDLFLESPVKLPFLNVDLPLTGFFWLGPGLFLIVHAYTLLHFALLANKTVTFDKMLRLKIPDNITRTNLRRQLPTNIFVQFLAGPEEVRKGVIGFLLRIIAWISLVIGPVLLLTYFVLQFLPYHSYFITWWQRLVLIADLALIWLLWPAIVHGAIVRVVPQGTVKTNSIVATVSLIAVFMIFVVATFPGEWLERIPSFGLHKLLVAGDIDFVARKPKSLWSNRLVLPGMSAIDPVKFDNDAKIDAAPQTASLRMRNLDEAVLIGAVLRKVDFTGASLKGAQLQFAKLQGAELANTNLDGALMDGAQLEGAVLTGAYLRAAELRGAQA